MSLDVSEMDVKGSGVEDDADEGRNEEDMYAVLASSNGVAFLQLTVRKDALCISSSWQSVSSLFSQPENPPYLVYVTGIRTATDDLISERERRLLRPRRLYLHDSMLLSTFSIMVVVLAIYMFKQCIINHLSWAPLHLRGVPYQIQAVPTRRTAPRPARLGDCEVGSKRLPVCF